MPGRKAVEDSLHDPESEEAVLGALFVDPEAIPAVACDLRASDFYDQRNAWIFEALTGLAERHAPVDHLTLCDELERRGHLNDVGGTARIVHLTTVMPSALHVEAYAARVAEDAQRRRLLRAASDIVKLAYNRESDIESIMASSEGALLAAVGQNNGRIRTAEALMADVYRQAEEYYQNPVSDGESRHLDTGWPDLNKALGGWRPGLHVVLAVPHLGKTWFCLSTAASACERGGRVLFFPLEMTADQLVERLCISYAQVTQQQYEHGVMSPEQWTAFTVRASQVAEWDLLIDDEATTIGQIVAVANREHLRKPLSLIVVDSLGLLEGGQGENRNRELGTYTRRLKLLARSLRVPVIAPHHIGAKAVAARSDKKPLSSDPYESGHVDMDADIELGLYRDEFYNPETDRRHILDVFVLKDRLGGGTGGWVNLYFSQFGEIKSLERKARGNGWADRKDLDL